MDSIAFPKITYRRAAFHTVEPILQLLMACVVRSIIASARGRLNDALAQQKTVICAYGGTNSILARQGFGERDANVLD